MRLTVAHGPTSHAVDLASDDPTPDDLRAALLTATGILPRNQKLVFKGKVLPGAHAKAATVLSAPVTLASLKIVDGSKLMLLAQAGGGPSTAGTAALVAKRAADSAAAAAKRAATTAGGGSGGPGAPHPHPPPDVDWAARAAVWAKTGIITLRDAGLRELPEAVLCPAVSAAATACDLGGNPGLTALPARFFTGAPHLTRLRLTGTGLARLPPEIGALTRLETLLVDRARLEGPLPAALASLPSLKSLSLAHNPGLERLQAGGSPASDGPSPPPPTPPPPFPPSLEVLDVSHCGLTELPAALGTACPRLSLVDARHNRISPSIPPSLSRVPTLRLDANRISVLPPTFFDAPGAATALLSLHANPITAEEVRGTPGWAVYDGRRLAAANKRLAGRAVATGGGTAFEEGADAVQWMSFGSGGG